MIGTLLGLALGAVAVAIDALGVAPGGPGLVLGIAAMVAAPRTTGTLSVLLGLAGLGVALGDGTVGLLTPLGWASQITLGLAMGAVARHVDHPTVSLCHEEPVVMALGLTAAAAFVGALPDGLLQFMTPEGAPLMLRLALSEPTMATQMPVAVPARLLIPAPLAGVSQWVPLLAGLVAIVVALGGLLAHRLVEKLGLAMVGLLAAALLVPALADLIQLAGGGPLPLPSPSDLVVELGWLGGGETGMTLHTPPESAHVTLASRPAVSVLRLVIALALVHWLWTRRGGGCPRPSSSPVSLAWVWSAVALALVSLAGFMGFASAERLDAVAAWGPDPMSWTVASGALMVAIAGLGSLFGAGTSRLSTGLHLLAIGVWCCGIVAPVAGWLIP